MKVNNILIAGSMYKEIHSLLEKEGLQKNVRSLPEDQLSQDDLNWANALVSFQLPSGYDYGHVKWVHSLGAGVDRFLYQKDWDGDVLLTRTICSFGQRIAEYCLSYILGDLQFHEPFQALKQQKKWQQVTPKLASEQNVMIYGTGEIGQRTAEIFSRVGISVYGVSLSGKEKKYFKEVMTLESHFSRLNKINYMINTLPLTDKTAGLFNENIFTHVSNIGFMNVGRGASLNEEALLHALNEKQVRFAVLDVFPQEPLPVDHLFWNHPRIQITPHISAVTTPEEGVACFMETLRKIEENRPIPNKVDIRKGY